MDNINWTYIFSYAGYLQSALWLFWLAWKCIKRGDHMGAYLMAVNGCFFTELSMLIHERGFEIFSRS
jgi:hypothetical protein